MKKMMNVELSNSKIKKIPISIDLQDALGIYSNEDECSPK